ncbi:hypothetical protein [Roseovarius aestuarii]|uniref:Uncharacterized protein n=1 Tax=Roseovarius aestuarii TaxID=475083 RepID=A0A1X7BXE9_9RHOB|nr:hypothetical protein [Roseovarius aestuarii]SMC14321.1 hypothetical protein ROA7745_04187 [Roseovarius aestuarii]
MSSHHETADSYHAELARHGKHRVIICKDGHQYILQYLKKPGAESPWVAIAYCTTKMALIRLSLDVEPGLEPGLKALPERARLSEKQTPLLSPF